MIVCIHMRYVIFDSEGLFSGGCFFLWESHVPQFVECPYRGLPLFLLEFLKGLLSWTNLYRCFWLGVPATYSRYKFGLWTQTLGSISHGGILFSSCAPLGHWDDFVHFPVALFWLLALVRVICSFSFLILSSPWPCLLFAVLQPQPPPTRVDLHQHGTLIASCFTALILSSLYFWYLKNEAWLCINIFCHYILSSSVLVTGIPLWVSLACPVSGHQPHSSIIFLEQKQGWQELLLHWASPVLGSNAH